MQKVHNSRVRELCTLLIGALASCSVEGGDTDEDHLGVTSQAVTPAQPTITTATSLGAYGNTAHLVRLNGDFPDANTTGHIYAPTAFCNGIRLTGNVARMYAIVLRQSPTAIDVLIPERPKGSKCSFSVKHTLGSQSTSSPEFGASLANPPIALIAPSIEIRGATTKSVVGGRQYFELFGRFPLAGTVGQYSVQVTCGGLTYGATEVTYSYRADNQINMSIPHVSGHRSCTFWAIRGSDGLRSPVWSQRVGSPPPAPSFLGGYYMGGYQPGEIAMDHALRDGVANLAAAGFGENVRLRLNPRQRRPGSNNTYNFNLDAWEARQAVCPPGNFLSCAIRSRYYQDAFNQAGLRVVMLTTYDSVVLGETGENDLFSTDPNFFTPTRIAAAVDEYRGMATAICETQRNTGKTFIISNWEADNHIFACGGISDYSRCRAAELASPPQPETSRCCEVKRNCEQPAKVCSGSARPTVLTIDQSIANMVTWFNARRQGIDEGIAQAAGGCAGVSIKDAVEINGYPSLSSVGAKSALTHVLPGLSAAPAYVAYSAWSSTDRGRLELDINAIRSLSPSGSQVILGELGLVYHRGKNIDWRRNETVRAAQRTGVPLAFYWQAYPNSGPGGSRGDGTLMGLLNDNGSDLYATYLATEPYGYDPVMSTASLRSALISGQTMPVHSPGTPLAMQVDGVNDRGETGAYRYFELYGNYDYAATAASVLCENDAVVGPGTVPPPVVSQVGGQVNISVQNTRFCWQGLGGAGCSSQSAHHYTDERWCKFSLYSPSFGWSPWHGPIRICRGTAACPRPPAY